MNSATLDEIEIFKKRADELTSQFENYFKLCDRMKMGITRQVAFEAFIFQQIAGLQLGMDHTIKLFEDMASKLDRLI